MIRKKILAKMLLQLIDEHKRNCRRPDCGITVYLFKDLYEWLVGRKVTPKEFKTFF